MEEVELQSLLGQSLCELLVAIHSGCLCLWSLTGKRKQKIIPQNPPVWEMGSGQQGRRKRCSAYKTIKGTQIAIFKKVEKSVLAKGHSSSFEVALSALYNIKN